MKLRIGVGMVLGLGMRYFAGAGHQARQWSNHGSGYGTKRGTEHVAGNRVGHDAMHETGYW